MLLNDLVVCVGTSDNFIARHVNSFTRYNKSNILGFYSANQLNL